MKGKKILIGITGSIAAYKIPHLVRLLIKSGAEVQVVMTPSATQFVSQLVLSTLSKRVVLHELSSNDNWTNHVMLGRWADVMVIAPATCNTISKMAHGLCDNLLLSIYMSATCPIMIVPAMDEDMWHHPAFQTNLNTLKQFGHVVLESQFGELASGLIGMGRMAEPEEIITQIGQFLNKNLRLKGKKALVTAGPTYENIDPVRFIGNHSSGKMGIALADALAKEGCEVHLVLGPSSLSPSEANIRVTRVTSAQEMYDAAVADFNQMDLAIMSAAVADYTPMVKSNVKIKKKDEEYSIQLTKTKDILKHLGSIKTAQQILVGFALETSDEKNYALKKLNEKNADAIILNSLNDAGAGFAHDTNKVTLFEKNGQETDFPLQSKTELANNIVEKIIQWTHEI
jgi:phosphopantothenoylcysteine decarboxylase/phosphopantothenate--cysteine ligase